MPEAAAKLEWHQYQRDMNYERGHQAGHEDGWCSALFIFGLRDCTIRNDSGQEMRVPIGRREAYIDLAPGETATIRSVNSKEWWEL